MTPDSLVEQATSTEEIDDLFRRYVVAIADASLVEQSADGRYVDAYTAGFLLAKIAIRASGYRVKSGDNHRAIAAAFHALGRVCPLTSSGTSTGSTRTRDTPGGPSR